MCCLIVLLSSKRTKIKWPVEKKTTTTKNWQNRDLLDCAHGYCKQLTKLNATEVFLKRRQAGLVRYNMFTSQFFLCRAQCRPPAWVPKMWRWLKTPDRRIKHAPYALYYRQKFWKPCISDKKWGAIYIHIVLNA